MPIRLETSRLLLRDFAPDDAESLYQLDHDPRVMEFLGPYVLDSVEAYGARIATSYAAYAARTDGLGLWALADQDSGRFLGWVCLRPAREYRFAKEAGFSATDAELGYRLRSDAWNHGYATEASRALIHDGFTRWAVPRVVAAALETNRRSLRVLEKCGMKRTGWFQLPGFDSVSARYELQKSELIL